MPHPGPHPAGPAPAAGGGQDRAGHWEQIYRDRGPREVSWFQADPAISAELIVAAAAGDRTVPVIDIGGGASLLAATLATSGFTDVTVLDISARALQASRRQDPTGTVSFLRADVLGWRPPRRWEVWHDRAVFHFLTGPQNRAGYLAALRQGLRPGGTLVLATFAPDGPTHCSGLPVARYSAQDLASELGEEFTVTAARTEQHHTPAGAIQPFTWISARLARGISLPP
jgi:trans-aconitate methyltransferase